MIEIRKKVLIRAQEICENWYEVEVGKGEKADNPEKLLKDEKATRVKACVNVDKTLNTHILGLNGIRATIDSCEWTSVEVVATNDLRELSIACVTYVDSFTPIDMAQETYRYGELGIDDVVDARYEVDEFGLCVVVELLNKSGTVVAVVQLREIEDGVTIGAFDKNGTAHPRKIVLAKPTGEQILDRTGGSYEVWKHGSTDNKILLIDEAPDEATQMLDSANILWGYTDSYAVDTETGRAYEIVDQGCADYVVINGEVIGRDRIEGWSDEERSEFIEKYYINNPKRALPCWFSIPQDKYERISCDFEAGWYGKYDAPHDILLAARDRGDDIFFQIESSQPFAVQFCVWRKQKNR